MVIINIYVSLGLLGVVYVSLGLLGVVYVSLALLGVVSKRLCLLHGRVGAPPPLVNSLIHTMGYKLVKDAVTSSGGDIVRHFGVISNEFYKFVELKL